MVAAKVLNLRPGRGPGSGVELNGKSVATMLLALVSSEIRSVTVERVKSLIKYKPVYPRGPCAVTGALNLLDSVAIGLERDCLWRSRRATLSGLRVARNENTAYVVWQHAKGIFVQKFSSDEPSDDPIQVQITLADTALENIIADLRAYMNNAEKEAQAK